MDPDPVVKFRVCSWSWDNCTDEVMVQQLLICAMERFRIVQEKKNLRNLTRRYEQEENHNSIITLVTSQ